MPLLDGIDARGHLQEVIDTHERHSPWDPDAQVEDMELTWRLHEAGRKTLVSATARAYAGPMVTVKGLMGQRRKWDEGIAALLWPNKMPEAADMREPAISRPSPCAGMNVPPVGLKQVLGS